MPGLISDQLINNLRTVAYKQLVTPVTIKRITRTEGPYGSQETLNTVTTVDCWYKPSFKGDLKVIAGGAISHASDAEFRFAVGVDVRVGDLLSLTGDSTNYLVQDVNEGATIQLYLKAWAERQE